MMISPGLVLPGLFLIVGGGEPPLRGAVSLAKLALVTPAVVHHGGAGTTPAVLRAEKPSVACPFVADQPSWGRRIASLGAGPSPSPQRRSDASKLVAAIKVAVSDAGMQRRAAGLGAAIRIEAGAANAVVIIEAVLCEGHLPDRGDPHAARVDGT